MCDYKRLSSHNFVDFCLQMTPTTSEVLWRRSPSRCRPSSLTRQTKRYADEMSYSRRSPSLRWISLWATTTVAVESHMDLFVASHWLQQSSSRFCHFARIQSSRSQYFTSTNHLLCSFISIFIEGLLQKPSSSSDHLWLVHGRDVTCLG